MDRDDRQQRGSTSRRGYLAALGTAVAVPLSGCGGDGGGSDGGDGDSTPTAT